MAINPINLRTEGTPGDEGMGRKRTLRGQESDKTFSEMIQNAISSVDDASKEADQKTADLVAGKTENVHDVMLSMTKAQQSFELMTEIRNKLLETYQSVSRMQI